VASAPIARPRMLGARPQRWHGGNRWRCPHRGDSESARVIYRPSWTRRFRARVLRDSLRLPCRQRARRSCQPAGAQTGQRASRHRLDGDCHLGDKKRQELV
jgi:hypothetical protein